MARNTFADRDAMFNRANDAWKRDDPDKLLAGMKQQDLGDDLNLGQHVTRQIASLENQLAGLRNDRDDIYKRIAARMTLLKSAIIADPDHGPDSSLYEAFGGVRKSERRSGLTRKKKATEGEKNES